MTNTQQTTAPTALSAGNPIGSPEELLPLCERALTVEHASLTYPAKAERARRNPKVALLYSDRERTVCESKHRARAGKSSWAYISTVVINALHGISWAGLWGVF